MKSLVKVGLLNIPWSPPVWGRGLKLYTEQREGHGEVVAPCVGAWVEISTIRILQTRFLVAPCVGAWVEIGQGLICFFHQGVAPCVGAWVEITLRYSMRV